MIIDQLSLGVFKLTGLGSFDLSFGGYKYGLITGSYMGTSDRNILESEIILLLV